MLGFSAIAETPLGANPQVDNVANITEDDDAVAAVGNSTIIAALSATEDDDTISSVANTTIVGAASITEADDTASGASIISLRGFIRATTVGGQRASSITTGANRLGIASTGGKRFSAG